MLGSLACLGSIDPVHPSSFQSTIFSVFKARMAESASHRDENSYLSQTSLYYYQSIFNPTDHRNQENAFA